MRKVTGKLEVVPKEVKVSQKGTPYTMFSINNHKIGQRYKCFLYNEQADKGVKELTTTGLDVEVDVWKQQQEEHGDVIIVQANTFTVKTDTGDIPTPTRKLGSISKEELTRGGKRLVTKAGKRLWQAVEDCVEVDGEWHEILEFCMDVLGPKKVTELMKEADKSENWKKIRQDILNLALMDHEANNG